jgi:hypothetical protein|tara:strand:- start:630 stop:839 length:210 start_codon:yes stop_codon:yes gene_type:complete
MTHIVSFVFGALLILFFMEMNVGQMKSYWQHAYQVGRDDGYTLGKAEFDITHEELEAKCMFLYADEYRR